MRRQRPHRGLGRSWVVTPKGVGEHERLLAVRLGRELRGVQVTIGDPIVHRGQPRGAGIGEPRDLHRGRLVCEHAELADRHVHRQIDQHVDAVRADQLGRGQRAQLRNIRPAVEVRAQRLTGRVEAKRARERVQLESRSVMPGEQRQRKERLTVIVEVRRHVTDAQLPLRIGAIFVCARGGTWLRVTLGPAPRFLQDRLGARADVEGHQEDQIAVHQVILRVQLDGAAIGGKGPPRAGH